MKHELPKLPFATDALAPYVSKETMEYHYGKHHKTYVDKLNKLLTEPGGTEFENLTLEEIITNPNAKGPIFNNASQAWNHTFFWNCLTPHGRDAEGEFREAINRDFGSLDSFKKKFNDAATNLFGSGWTWLVFNRVNGKLEIEPASNAGNPLRGGSLPLMTLDVWEHAYYIDYRNERPKFIESVWELWNWEFVERNFGTAEKQIAA